MLHTVCAILLHVDLAFVCWQCHCLDQEVGLVIIGMKMHNTKNEDLVYVLIVLSPTIWVHICSLWIRNISNSLRLIPLCKSQLVGRSLFCLGLLIRYGNSLLNASSNKSIDVASSLSLFKKYLLMEDFGIKVRALQVCVPCFVLLISDACLNINA